MADLPVLAEKHSAYVGFEGPNPLVVGGNVEPGGLRRRHTRMNMADRSPMNKTDHAGGGSRDRGPYDCGEPALRPRFFGLTLLGGRLTLTAPRLPRISQS